MLAFSPSHRQGRTDVVRMLLDNGAYANHMEAGPAKATPLDYAMLNNHADIVQLLVRTRDFVCVSAL